MATNSKQNRNRPPGSKGAGGLLLRGGREWERAIDNPSIQSRPAAYRGGRAWVGSGRRGCAGATPRWPTWSSYYTAGPAVTYATTPKYCWRIGGGGGVFSCG